MNVPAGQSVHICWPELAANEPGRHGAWLVAPTAHDEPAGHAVQSSARCKPTLFENEPASQERGEEPPPGQ